MWVFVRSSYLTDKNTEICWSGQWAAVKLCLFDFLSNNAVLYFIIVRTIFELKIVAITMKFRLLVDLKHLLSN